MADTAFKGILVGYPTDTYGYLVYNPQTRRVITTRHVRFDETFAGRLSEEGILMSGGATQPPRSPITPGYDSDDDYAPAPPITPPPSSTDYPATNPTSSTNC